MSADNIDKLKNNLVKVSSTSLTQSEKAIDIAHKLLFQDIEFNFNEGFKKMNSRQIRHSSINFLQQIESNHNFFNETNLEFEAEFDEDYKDALNLFLKILEIKPQHYYTLIFIGICFRELNDIEKSSLLISQAIELKPSHYLGYFERAKCRCKFISFDPDSIYWVLLTSLTDIKNFPRLIHTYIQYELINTCTYNPFELRKHIAADFKKSSELGVSNDKIILNIIQHAGIPNLPNILDKKRFDTKKLLKYYLEYFENLILKYGIKPNIVFNYAKLKIYFATEKPTADSKIYLLDAINDLTYCSQVTEFHYRHEAFYLNGFCYLLLNETQSAMREFNSSIRVSKIKSQNSLFLKSYLFQFQNELEKSIECLDELLAINPNYVIAIFRRMYLISEKDKTIDLKEINEIIEREENKNKDNYDNQDAMIAMKIGIMKSCRGKIKINLGDLEGAYKDYPELDPDYRGFY